MFSSATLATVYLEVALKAGVWAGDVAPTQFYGPVNFTKLELTPAKQETIRRLSNMLGSVGEALGSQNKATDPANLSGEIDTFNETLAGIILAADVTDGSQTGSSVTDEVVTTALNVWVKLAGEFLAATGFSLKTSGDVAVDADTYEVDTVNGMLRAIHADAVGTGMKASYTKATTTGRTYNAGKVKTTNLKLQGTALDKESGQYGRIVIHKAALISDQAIDIAVGGYVTGTLSGDLVTPTGEASPWSFTPFDITA